MIDMPTYDRCQYDIKPVEITLLVVSKKLCLGHDTKMMEYPLGLKTIVIRVIRDVPV